MGTQEKNDEIKIGVFIKRLMFMPKDASIIFTQGPFLNLNHTVAPSFNQFLIHQFHGWSIRFSLLL